MTHMNREAVAATQSHYDRHANQFLSAQQVPSADSWHIPPPPPGAPSAPGINLQHLPQWPSRRHSTTMGFCSHRLWKPVGQDQRSS